MGTGLGRSWMRAPNFRRLPKLQRFFGGGRARGPEVGGTEVARERRGFVGNTLHHGPSTAALGHVIREGRREDHALWELYGTHVAILDNQCPILRHNIISIITHITWTYNELMMKGVRRQRYTGCMTMMTMTIRRFFFLGSVL